MAYHTFHRWPKEAQEDVLQPAHKTMAGMGINIYIYTHTYFRTKIKLQAVKIMRFQMKNGAK